MSRYKCIFRARPATRLDAPFSINFGEDDTQVSVEPLWSRDTADAPAYQSGIQVIVVTDGSDIDGAVARGSVFANMIAGTLSLISGVGIPPPAPEIARELDAGGTGAQFQQWFDLGRIGPSSGNASARSVAEAMKNLVTMELVGRSRLNRALIELWAGQGDASLLGQFLHFWIGLEALNPLLQADLESEPETTKCRHCGERNPVPAATGLRDFVKTKMPSGPSLYRGMRQLRVALFHGKESLEVDSHEVRSLTEGARQALRQAAAGYLSVDVNFLSQTPPMSNRLGVRAWVLANLSGDLATIEASPEEPRLELENRGITIEPQSNGKPKITFHASFTSRFPPEVAVAIRETGLIGEGFSRVEAALEGP